MSNGDLVYRVTADEAVKSRPLTRPPRLPRLASIVAMPEAAQ